MATRAYLLGILAVLGLFITAPVHADLLHDAAKAGDFEQVNRLIAEGTDVNATGQRGVTALILASENGHHEIVNLLLSSGVDVNPKKDSGTTALIRASLNGHGGIATVLLSHGADVNATTTSGYTALMRASYKGYGEIATVLLSHGADVNAQNNNGATALHQATQRRNGEIVSLLLSNGADVNAKNARGQTALMHALGREDNGEIAKVLLSHGVDGNTTTNDGHTALMRASGGGHLEIVNLLLSTGANVNATTTFGYTALVLASEGGYTEIVNQLIAHGADVNAQEADGATSLIFASEKGHGEVVVLLLSNGANVNAKTSGSITSLFRASQNGHTETVNALLSFGADVNAKTNGGQTALIHASQYGHAETVSLLLSNGADVNAKNARGQTALMRASEKGHSEIVVLLSPNFGAQVTGEFRDVSSWETAGGNNSIFAAGSGTLWNERNEIIAEGDLSVVDEALSINGKKEASFLYTASETAFTDDAFSDQDVQEFATLELSEGSRWTLQGDNFRFVLESPTLMSTQLLISLDKSLARASIITLPRGSVSLWGYTITVENDKGTVTFAHGKVIESSGATYAQTPDVMVETSYGLETEGGPLVMRNGQFVPGPTTIVTGGLTLTVILDGVKSDFSTEIIGTNDDSGRTAYRCTNGESFYLDGQTPRPFIPNEFGTGDQDLMTAVAAFRSDETDAAAWTIWRYLDRKKE